MKYSRALEKGCGFHGSKPVKLMLRRVKTHTSIHSRRTAAGLCTSFTPTLHTGMLAPPRPPAGPHAGGQQQSMEELPAVAIATASPQRTSTGLAWGGGGRPPIYLWVPPGPLMTPAVSPGCGFFFPAVLSHPRSCRASGPPLPWALCLSEPFVMLTGSWGLPAAPQACGRVDGRALSHPVPWQVCRGAPPNHRLRFNLF